MLTPCVIAYSLNYLSIIFTNFYKFYLQTECQRNKLDNDGHVIQGQFWAFFLRRFFMNNCMRRSIGLFVLFVVNLSLYSAGEFHNESGLQVCYARFQPTDGHRGTSFIDTKGTLSGCLARSSSKKHGFVQQENVAGDLTVELKESGKPSVWVTFSDVSMKAGDEVRLTHAGEYFSVEVGATSTRAASYKGMVLTGSIINATDLTVSNLTVPGYEGSRFYYFAPRGGKPFPLAPAKAFKYFDILHDVQKTIVVTFSGEGGAPQRISFEGVSIPSMTNPNIVLRKNEDKFELEVQGTSTTTIEGNVYAPPREYVPKPQALFINKTKMTVAQVVLLEGLRGAPRDFILPPQLPLLPEIAAKYDGLLPDEKKSLMVQCLSPDGLQSSIYLFDGITITIRGTNLFFQEDGHGGVELKIGSEEPSVIVAGTLPAPAQGLFGNEEEGFVVDSVEFKVPSSEGPMVSYVIVGPPSKPIMADKMVMYQIPALSQQGDIVIVCHNGAHPTVSRRIIFKNVDFRAGDTALALKKSQTDTNKLVLEIRGTQAREITGEEISSTLHVTFKNSTEFTIPLATFIGYKIGTYHILSGYPQNIPPYGTVEYGKLEIGNDEGQVTVDLYDQNKKDLRYTAVFDNVRIPASGTTIDLKMVTSDGRNDPYLVIGNNPPLQGALYSLRGAS